MSVIRQVGILILLVALAGGAYSAYTAYWPASSDGEGGQGREGPRETAVVTAPAEMRRIERRIEAVGTSLALQAVDIVPLASGRIEMLGFQPGERVSARATLARLDDDIERADLTEAEAKLAEATAALERARTLRATNTVSKASLEQLVAAEAIAKASLDRARRRLADRTVTAPFAGIVGLRKVDVGTRVDDNSVITTLDDLSTIQIEFTLPEMVYGAVQPGLAVEAGSSAFPGRIFAGRIETIDSRIDPVSRAFKARAIVDNSDLALPAGMFLYLVVIQNSREALLVPEEAITVQAAKAFVYVVDDGKAWRRDVDLGQRDRGAIEILAGLRPGEAVVTRGVQSLRDGAPVVDAATAGAQGGGGEGAGGNRSGGGRPGGRGGGS